MHAIGRISQTAIALLLTLAVGGCASTALKSPEEAVAALPELAEGLGRLVVFRDCDGLGISAIRPDIRVNAQPIGPAHPSSFRFLDLAPGEYRVQLDSARARSVPIVVEAGAETYVRAQVSVGADLREGGLQAVPADEGRSALPRLALVDR